jgi:TRAP-type C4-dicarboxylate transport system substrate-binding protein
MTMSKMSKRTTIAGIAMALVLSTAGQGALAASAKYSDHDATGGMRTDFVNEVWLPEIETQTGGALTIRAFFGGTLLGSKEVLKGVGDNIAQMGFAFPGHYPSQMLAHSIFGLFPMGPEKFENQAWLYHTAYDEIPALKAELAKANVVPLMITAGLPGAFAGKKPLGSLADIQGDKWRAGGKWLLRYLGSAGASPVSVPWGDVYVALQTGTIDGVFTNYDGLHLMKFDEVAPNMLVSKKLWYAVPFLHFMNKEFFDSQPEDVQNGIVKASSIAEGKFSAVYDAAFDKVKSEQLASGVTVTELSDADIQAWANPENLSKHQADWVKEATDAGLANAAEIMEQMRDIHKRAMSR